MGVTQAEPLADPVTTDAGITVPGTTPARLFECADCGQVQVLPPLSPGSRAICLRCDAVLRQTRRDPLLLPLALNVSALVLFFLGATLMLMSVSTAGQIRVAGLVSGPLAMQQFGLWELSLVILVTTVAAPLARVLSMLAVLIGLRMRRPPTELRAIYAWVEHLRPWSMVEIYLLGLFVAYVRLGEMAVVDLGPAIYALGGLMVVMVLADYMLDDQAVWEALAPRGRRRRLVPGSHQAKPAPFTLVPTTLSQFSLAPVTPDHVEPHRNRWRIGCDTCGMVNRAAPGMRCARCGFRVHDRKPASIERTWAFSIAALILYIPANLFPVLTVVRLGAGQPSTILGGVTELIHVGMWPLAALVFFASVAVPVLKLAGLGILLISTHFGTSRALHDRTVLYRIIDAVGRWSMIDIFMASILVALVRFGQIASVYPGTGALAFAGVVILTMLAAHSFDPRLMWDSAQSRAHSETANAKSAGVETP